MSEHIKLSIDGLEVVTQKGRSILQAAGEQDIYIPTLCHHPDLKPAGVCRTCMVEVAGRGLVISCKTPVEEGMVVATDSPEIDSVRRTAVSLLVTNHHDDCIGCAADGHCALQNVASYVGVTRDALNRLRRPTRSVPVDTSNPFYDRDMDKCIVCGICVQTCKDLVGVSAIDFAFRGYDTTIAVPGDKPVITSRCISCGECVVRCPVGALIPKSRELPARLVKTICPYCGVGCGIVLGVRGNRIVNAEGNRDCATNAGILCVKGRYGHGFVGHADRLKTPLIRRNGKLSEASWDEALSLVAERLATYPGDAFAGLSSAKCTNEENYLFQKFVRAVMGTNNVDHCARLCHSPSVAGLAQSFGSGAMTNSIAEVADAQCILAIGTNTTAAHPVLATRMWAAVQRGAALIVANPKEIELCRWATLHLRQRPGSDVALMMGMARVIVDEGLHDRAFIAQRCEGFEELQKSLSHYDLDWVEKTTGVPKQKIAEAARLYATRKPAAIFYAMGVTQHTHGTDNVLATSNLALLTGNAGKPSTGVNPLRGQNNVQGACDLAALPNVFPGYQKVTDDAIRRKFEAAWSRPLSPTPGITHVEIFHAIHAGRVKALYSMGENPILSEADANHVREAIERLEFFVVQDIFLTETAAFADVVLPAAAFAEKDGTFTNTERRVQRVRKAVDAPGDAKPDWRILCELAQKMGVTGFDFSSPKQIMEEITSLTPQYAGITYERIETNGLQWPCTGPDHGGTQYLFAEKFSTPNGKAQFKPLDYRPPAEDPDEQYPLVLTTDRSLYHFHTSSMTGRVEGLVAAHPEERLMINPIDARALAVADEELVEVTSRRGNTRVRAHVTEICPAGVVSLTFHFANAPTNELTIAALDPVAKIPETKVCAVRVQKTGA
ncbi:MAG: formate dehydrogenase subunit alpha [Myxococcales bacterium]|nr:formate dehydrogenase subunit alpha [Myxococcales bacterium]